MMKLKSLFVNLLLSFCVAAHVEGTGKNYSPFAQDGKTWKSQVGLIMENVYGNRIDGDTLIGGEIWKKVYNYIGYPELHNSYYAAIRDVDKKVYAISAGSNRPRLLYDFGLKVGDMVRCGVEGTAFGCLLDKDDQFDTLLGFRFVAYLRVERIDTTTVRGMQHRRFTLTLLDAYREHFLNGEGGVINNVVWVEGIGSGAGPFSPWLPLPPKEGFLQSCELNGICIFGYPDFYEVGYINGISNTHNVVNEENVIIDLQGRQLLSPPAKCVYIENGLKRVAK